MDTVEGVGGKETLCGYYLIEFPKEQVLEPNAENAEKKFKD